MMRLSPIALLLPILLVGACASDPEPTVVAVAPVAPKQKPFPTLEAFLTLESGYKKVADSYVDDKPIGPLAYNGLLALPKIDSRLNVYQEKNFIHLAYDGVDAALLQEPGSEDARGWARITSEAMQAAARVSPNVRDNNPDQLVKTVFMATLSTLDPFSRYLTPDEAKEERTHRQGFGGIGVTLEPTDPTLISGVVPETPAEEGGLAPGDRIMTVDDLEAAGIAQVDLINKLRGKVGSNVVLTLRRAEKTFGATLTRRTIYDITVQGKREANDIAYLRVTGFNAGTSTSLRLAYQRLLRTGPLKGIVLDLRGNPGGLLDQGWDVADMFISDGPIMTMRDRRGVVSERDADPDDDIARGLPMVVLVNGRTASASEVVAAALQDSGRAVVIGSASYGKGLVQSIMELNNQGNLYLTTKRMHAPSGYHLQRLGVVPALCTTPVTTQPDADKLMADLRDGKLNPLELIRQRRAADASDEIARTLVAAACPTVTVQRSPDFDLDIGMKVVQDPGLMERAMRGIPIAAKPNS
ncbi:S41 family peptidase [Lacibacterium aquatile]|uniref:S41 family peptidase n=1 Tax=Lacibacterium aquatile TaxID=1168082 RepID=A0ABW5DTU1_9PROT